MNIFFLKFLEWVLFVMSYLLIGYAAPLILLINRYNNGEFF